MFCNNCGKEINDKAVVCPHCGSLINQNALKSETRANETNTIAIVGFILSFFIAIAGLICSIIGYKKAPEFNGNGKGLALAGIIISSLSIIFVSVFVIIIILGISAL